VKRRTEGFDQFLRHAGRGLEAAVALEQDGELVAAKAGEQRLRRQRGPQTGGDGDQERVTGDVAEAVVDDLEAVEVDQEDRDGVATTPVGGNRLLEPLDEARPGWEGRSGGRGRPGAPTAPRPLGAR
jgi:hypothetical protein